jgi:hypothetical protein
MLDIPVRYVRDTTSTKFKGISHQLPSSTLCVSAATRELWWMNEVRVEI